MTEATTQRATWIGGQTRASVPTTVALVLCLVASARAAEPSATPDTESAQEATSTEATNTEATQASPEEAMNAELEAFNAELEAPQRAFLEAQQAEIRASAAQPILTPNERRALRSELQRARLEKIRQDKELALQKAQASQSVPTAESAETWADFDAAESTAQPHAESTSLDSPAAQGPEPPPAPMLSPGALAELSVSFRQDSAQGSTQQASGLWVPRISGVLEREFTVLARVEGHDAAGRVIDVDPEWIPADPSTVAVSPRKGRTVKITVRGAGASNLTVVASGVSKDLWISAALDQHKAMKVEILQ